MPLLAKQIKHKETRVFGGGIEKDIDIALRQHETFQRATPSLPSRLANRNDRRVKHLSFSKNLSKSCNCAMVRNTAFEYGSGLQLASGE